MTNTRNANTYPGVPLVYQIRVKGHLGPHWSAWFDGLTITLEANGDTLLTGPVADQAALYGMLRKVRDVGLPLRSFVCMQPDQADGSEGQSTTETKTK